MRAWCASLRQRGGDPRSFPVHQEVIVGPGLERTTPSKRVLSVGEAYVHNPDAPLAGALGQRGRYVARLMDVVICQKIHASTQASLIGSQLHKHARYTRKNSPTRWRTCRAADVHGRGVEDAVGCGVDAGVLVKVVRPWTVEHDGAKGPPLE